MLVAKQEENVPSEFGPERSRIYQEGLKLGNEFCRVVSNIYASDLENFSKKSKSYNEIRDAAFKECNEIFERDWREWMTHDFTDFLDWLVRDMNSENILEGIDVRTNGEIIENPFEPTFDWDEAIKYMNDKIMVNVRRFVKKFYSDPDFERFYDEYKEFYLKELKI